MIDAAAKELQTLGAPLHPDTQGSFPMPLATTVTTNDVPIRLTEERWAHIMEEHGELAEMQSAVLAAVANPMAVYAGGSDERLAVSTIEPGKWLVVVYRETNGDGFIITAFVTRRIRSLERREKIWP